MELQLAKRQQVKLRIGISGPSGFGKTYSALLLAFGLTNDFSKIAVIDTENGSANLYAHLGNFQVISLEAPYSPERYAQAIEVCEKAGIEVIIIDSITHEWNGSGGCLEIHEKLGGRFQDWAKVSPRHQHFINSILQSKCHVITSARRKVNYSLDTQTNGRTRVVKHGTKEITREGFEYELTVNFELLNEKHLVKASKDRTGLFVNKPEFVINSATGKKLLSWCSESVSIEELRKEIKKCETLNSLKHLYSSYPNLQSSLQEDVLNRKNELEETSDTLASIDKTINT